MGQTDHARKPGQMAGQTLTNDYSLRQKFRTFKWDFFLGSLEEIDKLWKWRTVYGGVQG